MVNIVVVAPSATPTPEHLNHITTTLAATDATVTVTTERRAIEQASAIVFYGTGDAAATLADLTAIRGHELLERALAGGRNVLALGAAAILLFEDPQHPLDGIGQWPSVLADQEPTTVTLRCPEESTFHHALHGATVNCPEPQAPVHWEWPHPATPLMPAPIVTWGGTTPQHVVVVENGPLTAATFDCTTPTEPTQRFLQTWARTLTTS